jgi:hypothetical protein
VIKSIGTLGAVEFDTVTGAHIVDGLDVVPLVKPAETRIRDPHQAELTAPASLLKKVYRLTSPLSPLRKTKS